MTRCRSFVCALSWLLSPGCVAIDPIEPSQSPASPRFDALVGPVLEERCANPSCHGSLLRPFALYAPRRLRMDPDDVYSERPLTEAERAHNAAVSRTFAGTSAAGSPLLCKSLGTAAGCTHGGGALFGGPLEDGYVRLRTWIDEGTP